MYININCLNISHLQIMDNWLRVSLVILCMNQLYETGNMVLAFSITPINLETKGNSTYIMSGNDWRKEKEMCKPKQVIMKVGDPTCETKLVKNYSCRGYCRSIYIPQYQQKDYKVCTACLPTGSVKKTIALKCVRNGKKVVVFEEVSIIRNCKCADVEC